MRPGERSGTDRMCTRVTFWTGRQWEGLETRVRVKCPSGKEPENPFDEGVQGREGYTEGHNERRSCEGSKMESLSNG